MVNSGRPRSRSRSPPRVKPASETDVPWEQDSHDYGGSIRDSDSRPFISHAPGSLTELKMRTGTFFDPDFQESFYRHDSQGEWSSGPRTERVEDYFNKRRMITNITRPRLYNFDAVQDMPDIWTADERALLQVGHFPVHRWLRARDLRSPLNFKRNIQSFLQLPQVQRLSQSDRNLIVDKLKLYIARKYIHGALFDKIRYNGGTRVDLPKTTKMHSPYYRLTHESIVGQLHKAAGGR